MSKIVKISLLILLTFTFSGCFFTTIEHPAPVMSENEVAIDGYDVVGYFEDQKAEKGLSAYQYRFKSVDWYFINEQHRDQFAQNPAKYFPAFGGFCAYEMADERLVKADPRYWHIHNDVLFLFSEGGGLFKGGDSKKKEWFREISLRLPAAQAYWSMINAPTQDEKQEKMNQDFMNGTFY